MKNAGWINSIIFLTILGLFSSCNPVIKPLKEGRWRGAFFLRGNEIPFVFEVKGKSFQNTSVFLLNGEDRFELKTIVYDGDSVTIPIDLYDVILKGKLNENTFEGQFIKTGSDKTIIHDKLSLFLI